MRICPECGTPTESDSRFCLSCGLIFHASLTTKVQESQLEPEPEPERDVPVVAAAVEKANATDEGEPSAKKCPECGDRIQKGSLSCKVCGLIFFTKPAQPIRVVPRQPAPAKHRLNSPILISLIALVLVMTIYYLPEMRRLLQEDPNFGPRTIKARPSDMPEFDLTIDIAARPSGVTWNQDEFVLGNHDAESFVRVSHAGDKYVIRQLRLGAMSPLTWNGKQLVGYRESGLLPWFKKYQFTTHDATTLNIVREYSVPEPIGGLALGWNWLLGR